MTELRMGVLLPKALVKKPAPAGHNNNDGGKPTPAVSSVDRKNNRTMENLNNDVQNTTNAATTHTAAPAPAPQGRETVVIETGAQAPTQQVVSLQEVLQAGVAIRIDAPKKALLDHAIDTGKSALAVAGGIGVAAGIYAVGKWVAGFFGEDAAE